MGFCNLSYGGHGLDGSGEVGGVGHDDELGGGGDGPENAVGVYHAVGLGTQKGEIGTDKEIFYDPKHPYTHGLLSCIANPENDDEEELTPIPGSPPDLLNPPVGCPFVDRCTKAMKVCKLYPPEVTTFSDTHQCACWLNQKEAMNK